MKQKKTNHYLLGTVFCLLLLLLLTPGQATKVQAATDSGLIDVKLAEGIRRYDYAYEVLNLVNQERAKSNLQPVTMDKNLLECAMTRAQELTLYASHTRPNGTSCMNAFPYFGYNSSENLAINQVSPEDVMNSWMNSSGHRTNIMASGNVSAGIGCFYQNGALYWIQCFSSHAAQTCSQPANQKVSPTISALPDLVNISFSETSPVSFTEAQKTMKIYVTCAGFSYMKSVLDPTSFNWSTGDSAIASVNQNGVIQLKNAGTTTVTASMKSAPTKSLTAQLNAYFDLNNAYYNISPRSYNYTGSAATPAVTVTFNSQTLTQGKDYTVSFENNVNAGRACYTIKGLGLYKGTLTSYFFIYNASIRDAEITFDQSSYIYKGTPLTPKPTVTWKGKTLTEGKDYTLSWSNNNQQGNAYITVTGKGNFKDEKNSHFYIDTTPIHTAVIGNIPTYDYAPGKEFKPEPTVTLDGVLLKKDKDYVLSYGNNKNASSRYNKPYVEISGIGLYRSGVRKYFTINPIKVSGETVKVTKTNFGNGSMLDFLKNNVVVTYKGTQIPSDCMEFYSVWGSSDNEILAFTIEYTGNYTGESRNMTSLKRCAVSAIGNQTYKGSALTPKPTVKFGSTVLKEGTDYTLSWSNNTKVGTGSVTITGLNNYFASVTVNFKIVAPAPTATPTPKPTATPTPKPTATPTPKPTATPTPKPTATPTPKPTATPTPKPTLSRPTAKLATAWNSVTISWKRVANAQSYIIYRQTGSGRYTRLKTLNSRTFSYKDTRVLVGTKYTYRVRACRKVGSSYIYSAYARAVSATPTLSRPALTLKTTTRRQTISWRRVSGASGYLLYQKTGNGSFKRIKKLSSRTTTYTVSTRRGTVYSYKLLPYRVVNKKTIYGPSSAVKRGRAK